MEQVFSLLSQGENYIFCPITFRNGFIPENSVKE